MGIQKITFENGNVTAKIDADLYHFLYSLDIGILKGLKNECQVTLANNTLTFQDGYISIYGRIIYIENQTTIGVMSDSNKNGYVVLGVNTATNEVNLYLKELSSGFPTLTQTNLLTTEGLYEFALCSYTKTTTSVSLGSIYKPNKILSYKEIAEGIQNSNANYHTPINKIIAQVSNGVYQIYNTSIDEMNKSILYVFINSTSVISFPGNCLFTESGISRRLSYRYGENDYYINLTHSNYVLTLSCENTTHEVTEVYIKK